MTQSTTHTILICENCDGTGIMAGRHRSIGDDYPPAVCCSQCEGSGMVKETISYQPHHPTRLTPQQG